MADESDLTSDGGGGGGMIAGDHKHLDARFFAFLNGFGGLVSRRIHERGHAQEAVAVLRIIAIVDGEASGFSGDESLVRETDHAATLVAEVKISVLQGKAVTVETTTIECIKNSYWIGLPYKTQIQKRYLEIKLQVVIKRLRAGSGDEIGAQFYEHFGSSLDHKGESSFAFDADRMDRFGDDEMIFARGVEGNFEDDVILFAQFFHVDELGGVA